jgi:hypothetical protein
MPTINQLIKKGRKSTKKKTASPAMRAGFNPIKNRPSEYHSLFCLLGLKENFPGF